MVALLVALLAAPLADTVDALVRQSMAQGPSAAISVYVERKGEPPVVRAYGLANVELDAPATPDTVFRIGSISKQFAAAAILTLAETGKLALDDDIKKFVPTAPVGDRKITLRHLLTHTSGIPGYTEQPGFDAFTRGRHTPAEIVALVKDAKPLFAPGERYSYSNTGYVLLGMVVEQITGKPYSDAVAQLAARAGLSRTRYCDNEPIIAGRAAGYGQAGARLVNAGFIDMSVPHAAGAICSTARELAQWTLALERGRVVSAASFEAMRTSARTSDGKPTGYGLGLVVDELEGHASFGHGGAINGFVSEQRRFPAEGVTVIVLANFERAGTDLLADELTRAALGLPQRALVDSDVPPEEAARVAGRYSFGDEVVVVEIKGGKALLRGAEEKPEDAAVLRYAGGGDFVMPRSATHVRFVPADEKKARALQLGDGKTHWSPEAPRVE